MKFISWNVNGLRACLQKGFLDFFHEIDAEKKGYSGTALFTRVEPVSVTYGIGVREHDQEGRVITAEFEDYFVVSEDLKDRLKDARIHSQVMGSDHCPVELDLD